MPRKPWRIKGAKGSLTGPAELHLLTGCCFVHCELCAGGIGLSRPLGVAPWTLRDNARDVWARHRDRLLEVWRDPNGRQNFRSNFCAEALRGSGRTGVPCWAELVFDGATLPAREKTTWPADVKKTWQELKDRRSEIE